MEEKNPNNQHPTNQHPDAKLNDLGEKVKADGLEIMQKMNFSFLDIVEHLPKILAAVDIFKEKVHLLKDYEKTLNLKEDEALIYSFIPVVTKEVTEIFCKGFVMTQKANGETVLTREVFSMKAFEELDKYITLIPRT